mmetsp:Transcript_90221/g.254554  ORF Transcript_90221/g.254554 Transcript_90221/m.254554 type:complete len:202 (-) Transcript_90221:2354-2959(-)
MVSLLVLRSASGARSESEGALVSLALLCKGGRCSGCSSLSQRGSKGSNTHMGFCPASFCMAWSSFSCFCSSAASTGESPHSDLVPVCGRAAIGLLSTAPRELSSRSVVFRGVGAASAHSLRRCSFHDASKRSTCRAAEILRSRVAAELYMKNAIQHTLHTPTTASPRRPYDLISECSSPTSDNSSMLPVTSKFVKHESKKK